MRAMVLEGFGRRLTEAQVPKPDPGPGEVLLRVRACGVCQTDLKILKGGHASSPRVVFPHIPGHEVSGVVEELGPGTTGLSPGDLVVVNIYDSCGECEYCRSGRESLCVHLGAWIGFDSPGGMAEYVRVPARNVVLLPRHLAPERAAILGDAIATSVRAIKTRGEVRPGQTVLITGAGGVGLHAVQVACGLGARVIAADISASRLQLARLMLVNPNLLLLDEPTNNLDINTIRWLETVLNGYDSTMIIISHDRHFLNQVCTHMADLDYGELRVYPGNYDDYMLASTQARERQVAANARAKERVSELQDFVRRFAANKSKSRQATSRLKQIDRIKSETVQVKPSSRQNPYIRFEVNKVLHRQAAHIEDLSKAYDRPIIQGLSTMIEAGQKVAIIGANGVGKTTLLRLLAGNLSPDDGHVRWSENADIGYMAQDVSDQFDSDRDLFDWMTDYRQPGDEDQSIRSVLGRLLFSGDEITKAVRVLSGGEKNRMSFGRLMLGRHNVMLMDEPTNHLDMESIESLQYALEQYQGTLVFVSHDRQFVSGVATRVIEILPDGRLNDYPGTYEEYLASQGIEA